MVAEPATVIVDDGTDALAGLVASALRRRGRHVIHVEAPRLGLLDVHLADGRAEVDGQPVGAVLFRATSWSRHDAGYADDDTSFVSIEVAATWLAITRLPGVAAINRLHPEASVTFSEWPVWRRALEGAGVPQPEIWVGDAEVHEATWIPWGGGVAREPGAVVRRSFAPALLQGDLGETGVWLDGSLLAGSGSEAAEAATSALAGEGIRLAGITLDDQGRVAQVTAHPVIDAGAAASIADDVAEALPA